MTVPLDSPLLRASDVSRLLGLPKSSVFDYARRKHDPLPSIRIGRHVRFERGAIQAWLARQRRGGAGASI